MQIKNPLPPFITNVVLVILFLIFTPIAVANEGSLEISNIQIKSIGYTSVTIAWITNQPSNSQVSYGHSSIEEFQSPASKTYSTDHSITLTSLKPDTEYLFQVTSSTESGFSMSSQTQTFKTLSFTFDESVGNFAQLNATPTPTPYYNPYAQSVPQASNMSPYYAPGGLSSAPIYLVPPIIYQQPNVTGQTLGAQETSQPNTTTIAQADTNTQEITSLIQSSMWGIVGLFFVIALCFALIVLQFQKNRKQMQALQKQIRQGQRKRGASGTRTRQPKTYSFDVG
jgi:hypothetical protein